MFSFLFLAALCASCLAAPTSDFYYSPAIGPGTGTAFTTQGDGRITAIRLWEINGAYIAGLQVRNDFIWSDLQGRKVGSKQELELFEGETIIQVSGKYQGSYIYQLVFVTSRGRSLIVGQPTTTSFNFHSNHPDAELRLLSGRHNNHGITSLGAFWGVYHNSTY